MTNRSSLLGAALVATMMASAAAFAQQPAEKRWSAVAQGRVEPASGIIKVTAAPGGVVSKVLVKVNDKVFAGEPLILLNDDEIQSRYLAAETQAAMREGLRDEKEATGKADERRKAEDALADAGTSVFDAQMALDRAAMAGRASGSAPAAEMTKAREALQKARAGLAEKEAALKTLTPDTPLPTPLESQVTTARGDLNFARVNIEKSRIRAPIDGTVLQINIHPGELASPQLPQPVLLIADLSSLNVRAEIDERDLSGVKIGQKVAVRAAAFEGRDFPGTVTSIAPLVEASRMGSRGPGNRSDIDAVEVVVKLDQPGALTAGMKVDVFFSPEQAAGK